MEELQKPILSNENGKEMDEVDDLFQSLEKNLGWEGYLFGRYHGFWLDTNFLQAVLSFQAHFKAKDTDIIIATLFKSGTTWLKALTFSIVNRRRYSAAESPLLYLNPHQLVPFLEMHLYNKEDEKPDMESIPDPRIFSTHTPHQLLPDTILDSRCKILYLCRNPLDMFVSAWHFSGQNGFSPKQPLTMYEAFEVFCEGINFFGPFWDHMLGYWHASLKNPEKVLFLKYEDLKKDITSSVKKIADFLGFSFSAEEERDGVIEDVTRLCCFENLKNLEVNKNGEWEAQGFKVKYSAFFRKGEVGDWANHLSPSMVERLQKLMEEKFGEAGLNFEINT